MAIILNDTETLVHTYKVQDGITLDTLLERAKNVHWNDHIVNNEEKSNFEFTDERQLIIRPENGEERALDITDNAFSQLCVRLGVPARYIKKCFEAGKSELAVSNFRAWQNEKVGNMLVRESDGVARAVLSDTYVPFDNHKVLKALNYTIDKKFEPTQVFMSQDKLHIRFVDYRQLPITDGTGSPLYAGVVVSSNSVGCGSLTVKYFIYRSVCKNGMAISALGGTLFQQKHIGERMSDSKISTFTRAFMDIDMLSEMATKLVSKNNSKSLSEDELKLYISKAKRELKLSDKTVAQVDDLMNTTYGNTKWGLINGLTEVAQNFTLDTRYDIENWAGALFTGTKA